MPAPINETIKRRVIQQWLSGEARAKIAIDNNVGEGTVSSIINYFKVGLDNSEFDSARERLNLSELASSFRLHDFIRNSGAAEDKIESFIENINSSNLPPERIVALVNQLYDVSKKESIPLEHYTFFFKHVLF